MNIKTRSNNNKNSILHMTVLIVLALLVIALPLAASALAGPEEVISDTAVSATGVQGGAFEVTDYDLTAAVGKDHSYTVEEKISVNIPESAAEY